MLTAPKRIAQLEKELAELREQRESPPQVQINLAPGATYQDFRAPGGVFHIHIDGGAEVVSPTPVRIAGRMHAAGTGTDKE